ncbi:hypothetical protein FACS189426_20430 [Bacteroidia bacterium]|nr:hypothetical protein FACS189426_20430 [Bacteroidia bacterium]
MITSEQFKEIYARYKSSGLTVRGFCANEGLQEARFYYWQKRMRNFLSGKEGFVPLVIHAGTTDLSANGESGLIFPGHPPVTVQAIQCEITYSNGTRLKLKGSVDYKLLRSLLFLNR